MELGNILDRKNREDVRRELRSRWKFEFERHLNTVFSFPSARLCNGDARLFDCQAMKRRAINV